MMAFCRSRTWNFEFWAFLQLLFASLVVKSMPAKQETQVRTLGQEDPLEKEMMTHSSILAWEIPWTEEPGGLQSVGSQRGRHNLATGQEQGAHMCGSLLWC